MAQSSTFVAVGNLCENFTSELKHLSHRVVVRYHVKKRCYGSKVVIIAKNRETDRTILYSLVKIRSPKEIDLLKFVLSGMDQYIVNYSTIPSGSDSN